MAVIHCSTHRTPRWANTLPIDRSKSPHLAVCIYVCVAVWVHLSVCLSVSLYVNESTFYSVSVRQSVYRSVYVCVCPSVCLSACFCLCICLSVCVSVLEVSLFTNFSWGLFIDHFLRCALHSFPNKNMTTHVVLYSLHSFPPSPPPLHLFILKSSYRYPQLILFLLLPPNSRSTSLASPFTPPPNAPLRSSISLF